MDCSHSANIARIWENSKKKATFEKFNVAMYDIILKNICCNGSQKDIFIKDDRIAAIKDAGTVAEEAAEVMDCSGKAAMPGFVNMHTHAAMSLMRGVGEDMAFHEWLAKVWAIEENLDEEFIYWGTKVACLEMIKTGTTTFNDHYWFPLVGHKAATEMGVRPVSSYVVINKMTDSENEIEKARCWKMYDISRSWDRNLRFSMAFHAPYSVSEPMMIWAAEFARAHKLPLHIHLSETKKEVDDCMAAHGGLSPVEYLESIGVLGPNLIAAHTLWLSDRDIEILGRNRVTCVHNINSNLKLSSGYHFPYKELREAGCMVCIGTDGCASSNNLDMLEAMKTSAMMQKGWRFDPTVCPLDEIVEMATVNGAVALGLDTGLIEEGKIADIQIVDISGYNFLSPAPFLANYVYSAHSDCIDSLIDNGKFIMRHRKVEGEEEILREARKVLSRIEIKQ